ncbi:MAG: polyribonucleotide nucleotidyltransferase [Deltaproteobacteria bacterium RIFCSPLOWO2_02_FULL_50_16]|nr:MAG: polyribonucleotide nucleotidyltransferase [Deltaproteobacteria bacterium GWA2_50_8]OGQ25704.1 MAG: polyribonucleotide nucleotidyltransferase [Deltaproteobacteria bacterium RIFCSPHIGHO2_02_FULL_50_15]OGQ56967.1 MAG: polyribonucleotide nucleotidyltransferase [Deltaproteobacteria bacterium RIFCSPLOWO2_02_FULL_50_16]OGQ68045.1 MAG: polyribonucleotide nucleotidyltransferase [Deltaproteobacteria bacterium RIFCSPLOWO2_12_FULL_50_11]
MVYSVSAEISGRKLTIETGKMAKQAGGAVTIRYGDSIVLVTATIAPEIKEGTDFLPLTVDYLEKTFAVGKIPGGFFRREGRPSEVATLTNRFIDRPIRPLFPKGYYYETQVIATILSADQENETDIMAITGASAALMISQAPFLGPIAGVRVCRINGKLVCNPKISEADQSDIDLIIAASREAVVMVEGGANEIPEKDIVEAIAFGHQSILPLLDIQEDLKKKVGLEKIQVSVPEINRELSSNFEKKYADVLDKAFRIPEKIKRRDSIQLIHEAIQKQEIPEEDDGTIRSQVESLFGELEKKIVRDMIVREKKRIDGRGYKDIRPITCEVGLLPRAHGSALFTRGETQVLVASTLGTSDDEQFIDSVTREITKRFMLHYNFPPFSVGEARFLRSPGRREIGHGALAERALIRMLPSSEDFPYAIRTVAEVLESNGSSSMASVCGGSLSLMDAGIPIKSPVAGIAMGLIKEGESVVVLSDILGDEDHLGDMDFKVTGTEKGVTALQMDIKITGINEAILTEALEQARQGRLHILGKMNETLSQARPELSQYAPRIQTMQIKRERIKDLIGPGGSNIRTIIAETGTKINVDDDGNVQVYSVTQESMEKAFKMIRHLTADPEMGLIYMGKVKKIVDFGAFVEIMPGREGLLHISQIDFKRIDKVTDVLEEGDEVPVKVIGIERDGKIRLSRKEALSAGEKEKK